MVAAAEQRQDRVQRRFLQAVKAVATVRKLLVRTPSPIEVATRLTTSGWSTGGRTRSRQAVPCGVEN